jgi:uncharacterized protein YidB (DUF937 family)
MGILDSIIGQASGGGGTQTLLVNAVIGLINNQQTGGLAGLVKQFAGSGLGDIVNSWVSTGKNLPVTPQQIQQGLGSDVISQLAAKVGLSPQDLTSHLSNVLPQVVDKLTPDGKIPQGDLMSKGMSILEGLMK